MRSINDNFKKKKELENALNKLRERTEREEDRLLRGISEQAQYILMYSKHPEDVAIGMQLAIVKEYPDKYNRELSWLLNFAIKKIEEGYLPELVQKKEVFGYWYNAGFKDGHSRVIHRNYGEDHASERAQIRLVDSLYYESEITTQETLAILAYLKQKLMEIEAQS